MEEYDELNDIDEAKMIISLKLDEIKNIQGKITMIDKRANIRIAEANYKIEQEKSKLADSDKKIDKLKESVESQRSRASEVEKTLKEDLTRLKQSQAQCQRLQRQKQRQSKAQLLEQSGLLEREKQQNQALRTELKMLKRIVPVKAILLETQCKSVEELPTYLNLLKVVRDKQEEVGILNRNMEQYRNDTLSKMEQAFSQLTGYEEVVEQMRKRNEQLEDGMQLKQLELKQHQETLEKKTDFFEQVDAYTSEKFQEMNYEIAELRNSIKEYQGQSQIRKEQEDSLAFLLETTRDFQLKEEAYIVKIEQLTDHCDQLIKSHHDLDAQMQLFKLQHQEQLESAKQLLEREQRNTHDKESMVEMLTTTVKEVEADLEAKRSELERCKLDIGELIKKKRKHEEQANEREQTLRQKEAELKEEIDRLKTQQRESRQSSTLEIAPSRTDKSIDFTLNEQRNSSSVDKAIEGSNNNRHRNSLLNDLGSDLILLGAEGADWQQLYENVQRRHNQFMKKVQAKLSVL